MPDVLDWTTNPTGLMRRVGKGIKEVNARAATITTDLPAELDALETVFGAADREDQLTAAYAAYDGFRDGHVGVRQRVAGLADVVLQDKAEVLDLLGLVRGGMDKT